MKVESVTLKGLNIVNAVGGIQDNGGGVATPIKEV